MRDNIKGGALTETCFLILLSVYEPNHGYGIKKFIAKETNGRLDLGAGTLYGALNTLLKKKWIMPYDNDEDSRKHRFIITEEGKQVVEKELMRLNEVLELAIKVTGGNKNHKNSF